MVAVEDAARKGSSGNAPSVTMDAMSQCFGEIVVPLAT
jgi:hypothetical protein